MVTTTTTRRCSSIMVVLPTWLCVFIREGEDSKVNYDLIWSPRHPRHVRFFSRWEREDTQPGITDTHLPDDDLLFDKSFVGWNLKRRNRRSDLVDVDIWPICGVCFQLVWQPISDSIVLDLLWSLAHHWVTQRWICCWIGFTTNPWLRWVDKIRVMMMRRRRRCSRTNA